MTNPKRIGELNGPWSVLLRIALATYPLLLVWGAWVSKALIEVEATRFTMRDGRDLEDKVDARFEAHRPDHPPEWVRQALERHETHMREHEE